MSKKSRPQVVVAPARVSRAIVALRGHSVMLDTDLADLYRVDVRTLNQAVQRNRARFPIDFMFQLTARETKLLRSQIVILESGRGRYARAHPRPNWRTRSISWNQRATGGSRPSSRRFAS
jgi:hypothetical protein